MAKTKFGPSSDSEDEAKTMPEVEAAKDPDTLKQKKTPGDMLRKGLGLYDHALLTIAARKEETIFNFKRKKKDVAKEASMGGGGSYE